MVRFMMYLINFLNANYAVKHENRPTLHFMVEKMTANIIFQYNQQLCAAVKGNEPASMAITISKCVLSAKTTVRACAISLTSAKPMAKKIPKLTSPRLASRRPMSLS